MYSDLYIQQKKELRLPKVFIIAVIALLAVLSSQVFMWYRVVPSEASSIKLLKHEQASIADMSAIIFYKTNEKAKTYVLFGTNENNLSLSAYPMGDIPGSPSSRVYHTVELTDLEPFTTYYYKIITDNKQVVGDEKKPFSIQTRAKSLRDSSARKPIYGRIVKPDGEGLAGATVLVRYTLSGITESFITRTKNSGEWLTTVSASVDDDEIITAEVFYEDFEPSIIQAIFEKAAPIPQSTVIGTSYNFTTKKGTVLPASTTRSDTETYTISLLYPQKDALIPNNKPLFRGFGVPGTPVVVQVNSKPQFETRTTIDKRGSWSIEPSRGFAPGSYVANVIVRDNRGAQSTITRTFSIAKSGEQVLGEKTNATPSATLLPTQRVTTVLPTSLTPTSILTLLTPTLTIITATPALTGGTYTITPTPPVSGGEFPLWFVTLGSLSVAMGALLMRLNPSHYTSD